MDRYILILYYSVHGSTLNLAEEIALGIEALGIEAKLRTIPRVSPVCEKTENNIPDSGSIYVTKEDLKNCSGLIIGSPTRFGNMASPMKYFLDTTSDIWINGELEGKVAGVFTSTSSMHGGQESTLLNMMIPLMHHGMIISGVPFTISNLSKTTTGGTPYGPSHVAINNQTTLSHDEKTICQEFGKRIALLAKKLN